MKNNLASINVIDKVADFLSGTTISGIPISGLAIYENAVQLVLTNIAKIIPISDDMIVLIYVLQKQCKKRI
jgi:hypothetical protein